MSAAVEELRRVRDEVAQELAKNEEPGRWVIRGYCAGLRFAIRRIDSALERAKKAAEVDG